MRKLKKKNISRKYKKGNKISVAMRAKEYETEFIVKDNKMYCKMCHNFVDFRHKNVIDSHLGSKKHKKNIEIITKQSKINQSFEKLSEKDMFLNDLVLFMTSNNIAFEKVNNKEFREFFLKYCKFGECVPTAETLRKFVPKVYENKQKKMIENLKRSEGFSVIVDETQDKACRAVLNLLVTPSAISPQLSDDFKLKSILIDTIFLNNTVDSNTIVRETNKSLINLGLNTDKITAFVSDNATYMIKAYECFQVIWPNSVHMTCHSHIFNLVAETFRNSFIEVDLFLAKMKSFFKKSRFRQRIFFETCNKALPKTCLTRWNSWLEAIVKHNQLFENYMDLIKNLHKEKINSPVIITLKQMIENPIIKQQIKFISSVAEPIMDAISCSQKQELMCTEIHKYTNDLMALIREIYVNIDSSDEYLNEYSNHLNGEQFLVFKESLIDGLNQTLFKLELYFDFGKEPAMSFLKTMQIFDPNKGKYIISSVEEAFNSLVSIPEFKSLIKSNDLLKKSQLSIQFKAYCESVKGYVKPENSKTNAYIANYWKSNYENWKLLAPIVYKYLFVPISSADVERSFSCFNNVFSDKRRRLSEENLKYLTSLYHNSM
jgi:hypothetical protein